MTAYRLVLSAAALATLLTAALVAALISFTGQALSQAAHRELAATPSTSVTVSGQAGAGQMAVRALSRVPGVQHVAGVDELPWTTARGRPVTVLAVDPARYAALVASTPWPPVPAGKLAGPAAGPAAGPVPVLASPSAAALLGPQHRLLESAQGHVQVRVAGVLAGTPALPGGGVFVVLPSWALPAAARAQPPSLLLLTGPRLDGAALTTAAHHLVHGVVVQLRAAALARLAGSPLPRGAYLGFAAGLGAAAGFSVVVLMLELALGAEERRMTLARLTTMGLRTGQARRLTLMETLPGVLAAALAGLACALVLVPLTGPVLNLSVFTGSAVPVPIRPGWAALGVPIVGLAGLAVSTLLLHIRVERRRGVTAAMRVGQ